MCHVFCLYISILYFVCYLMLFPLFLHDAAKLYPESCRNLFGCFYKNRFYSLLYDTIAPWIWQESKLSSFQEKFVSLDVIAIGANKLITFPCVWSRYGFLSIPCNWPILYFVKKYLKNRTSPYFSLSDHFGKPMFRNL